MLKAKQRSLMRLRSIVVAGHKTSATLEQPFWIGLDEIAAIKELSLDALITQIDDRRELGSSLSSALRLFVLNYYRGGGR